MNYNFTNQPSLPQNKVPIGRNQYPSQGGDKLIWDASSVFHAVGYAWPSW